MWIAAYCTLCCLFHIDAVQRAPDLQGRLAAFRRQLLWLAPGLFALGIVIAVQLGTDMPIHQVAGGG